MVEKLNRNRHVQNLKLYIDRHSLSKHKKEAQFGGIESDEETRAGKDLLQKVPRTNPGGFLARQGDYTQLIKTHPFAST